MKKVLFSAIFGFGLVMNATARPIFDVNNVQDVYDTDEVKSNVRDLFEQKDNKMVLENILNCIKEAMLANDDTSCNNITCTGRIRVLKNGNLIWIQKPWERALQNQLQNMLADNNFLANLREGLFDFDGMYIGSGLFDPSRGIDSDQWINIHFMADNGLDIFLKAREFDHRLSIRSISGELIPGHDFKIKF